MVRSMGSLLTQQKCSKITSKSSERRDDVPYVFGRSWNDLWIFLLYKSQSPVSLSTRSTHRSPCVTRERNCHFLVVLRKEREEPTGGAAARLRRREERAAAVRILRAIALSRSLESQNARAFYRNFYPRQRLRPRGTFFPQT